MAEEFSKQQIHKELLALIDLFDKVQLTKKQKEQRRKKSKLPIDKKSGDNVIDTISHLRVCIKYSLLDSEALTRERNHYMKILNENKLL